MEESGTLEKTSLVFGQMNEPPGARLRVGLTALTIAEGFRDQGKRCFSLSTTSSALLRPVRRSGTAWSATSLSAINLTFSKNGHPSGYGLRDQTGFDHSFKRYVPADDLTDPAPATTLAHLDSTIVLNRP